MGNTMNVDSLDQIVSDDPLVKEYKAATLDDFSDAKENFTTLQATLGDKMTVTPEEFDEIFSLICQDSLEHFALFDSWEVGKVDVMEVFAVIIVYCDATMEEKIPLLFDLFDFDHSKTMSQDELVLLMLCTTRGLCKVLGMPRPATDSLETLATDAFSRIDRDRNGKISLEEFAEWILHERTVMAYLAKFANTRVIYENQVQYDLVLNEICTAFMNFAEPEKDKHVIVCSEVFCEEIIQRYCSAATKHEIEFLLRTMKDLMKNTESTVIYEQASMISMDTFFLVISPFIALIAADDDEEHSINIKELKILIWIMFGSEPSSTMVKSFMESLDADHDGSLSAMEWVSYALEINKQTGRQSFANQIHLLFATSDTNGDAILSLPELQQGLISIFTDHLERVKAPQPESAWQELTSVEKRSISSFASDLVREILGELDANDTRRIEWYEFRQHLDYLEQRVMEFNTYLQKHVLN